MDPRVDGGRFPDLSNGHMLGRVRARDQLTVLGVAALLAFAGCGGDEQSGGDYREDANDICRKAERGIEALPTPSSIADIERYLRKALEISKEYDREFKALEPPADLRAEHQRLMRVTRRGKRLIEGLVNDVAAGDPRTLARLQRALPELERIARESNALAKRMDLPDCLNRLTPPGSSPEPS
jgi:hypothetical protein